ncbi:MAG: hypothetical protein HY433_03050 [Candidatus Liptonbacteria bacterium]|nr:hypothetical protein [Candidatus Liptonbacteria bacterium]
MTKIIAAIVLGLLIVVLGNEIYFFWSKNRAAETRYRELKIGLDKAKADYGRLEEDFKYYLNPANLEKELRARFNYRQPGENLIIIVPKASSTNE